MIGILDSKALLETVCNYLVSPILNSYADSVLSKVGTEGKILLVIQCHLLGVFSANTPLYP